MNSVLGIFLALVSAVFFTSIEIAFVSASKLHIELQEEQGLYSGKVLSRFVKNTSGLIGTTLIGKILSTVAYAILVFSQLYPWLKDLLQTTLYNHSYILLPLSLLLIFTGYYLVVECLTKFLFLVNPHRWLQIAIIPFRVAYILLYPFMTGMATISRWVIKHVLRIPEKDIQPLFSQTELTVYLEQLDYTETAKEEDEVDTQIFNNALSFKRIKVRDCMIPRTEISAIDIEEGMSELKREFVESGHSKVLVYKDSIDNIIGYCHAIELFKKPKDIQQLLTPVKIVAETTPVTDVLIELTQSQKSLAVVVDEYGGTSGLVSIEDIIEQLLGEIQDEYDISEDWVEEKLNESTYLLSARHEIDYLNDKYNLNLPKGEYGTLGGLIISIYEDLPSVNKQIQLSPFTFTILSMKDSHIDVVKLSIEESKD
ncbi:hemolysin family protein [Cytophagaceae bacterium YF14B1]|uniref:Hemolysin family protein n=1 Tax=Xanthocytophaga flava TaxID=3048013 RepID=A0AAE3QSX2_9BACT|nr:hemolysin family protein [Xanthocytophaga flavus]MDJ1484770.1 hemolysin family protein [Xanthocytophaga flavus]